MCDTFVRAREHERVDRRAPLVVGETLAEHVADEMLRCWAAHVTPPSAARKGAPNTATSFSSTEASTTGPCWSAVTSTTAVRSPQTMVGTSATKPSRRVHTVTAHANDRGISRAAARARANRVTNSSRGPLVPMMTRSSDKSVPSLDEADRVVTFVLNEEAAAIAADIAAGSTKTEMMRRFLALTIAVLIQTEKAFRAIGPNYPTHWDSMERSANTFTDEHVIKWLAENNPVLKRAITRQRRRKLAARAGRLQLVESDRDKRARWAAVTVPENAPMPIAADVAEDLLEATMAARTRLEEHLALDTTDPLVLAGQIVGLLSASEVLLAMFPSNKVAAFCVDLASLSANAPAV